MPNETPNSSRPSSSSRRGRRRPSRPRRGKDGRFLRVTSTGGIVYRIRDGHVEFFFIRDGYGKWTFPKGKPKLGETLAQAAMREIREETGLTGLRYVASLGKTSFRYRRGKVLYE
ncbi:NUDIX domain-containing protein, partial [Candidatus Uhrbacteria bacterium]|nr:NUDIX domain-containing protein [Candidatus Uhrbacteria bacterium]